MAADEAGLSLLPPVRKPILERTLICAVNLTCRHNSTDRSIVGGLVGLASGYVVALLLTGFDVRRAFEMRVWFLPMLLGVVLYGVIVERRKPG
ncbi:hypothetical protein [Paenarthrobacter aromaticivorans]|uniref:hypothetical protein n=1 Tax=Paenarthrobacter aromaticivorans TaxID=2849150 RepID=UPI003A801C40